MQVLLTEGLFVCLDVGAMPKRDFVNTSNGRRVIETPLECSPAQMRLALHRAGLLATVQAIADSDPEASIVWEYATVIVRDSPFIVALEADSGFTSDEIDSLFLSAMSV